MMQSVVIRRHGGAAVPEAGGVVVARHPIDATDRSAERHRRLAATLASARCDAGPGGRRRRVGRPRLAGARLTDAGARVRHQGGVPELGWRVLTTVGAPGEPGVVLRITRRGRLLLTAVVALAVLTVATTMLTLMSADRFALSPAAAAALSPAQQAVQGPRTINVLPGQTLWQIAQQTSPDADPRDVVIEFRELNRLPDSRVYAGQVLDVPR